MTLVYNSVIRTARLETRAHVRKKVKIREKFYRQLVLLDVPRSHTAVLNALLNVQEIIQQDSDATARTIQHCVMSVRHSFNWRKLTSIGYKRYRWEWVRHPTDDMDMRAWFRWRNNDTDSIANHRQRCGQHVISSNASSQPHWINLW